MNPSTPSSQQPSADSDLVPASQPIWLVGMMGVGKSTIGPLLAKALGRPFCDTDHEIERAAGCKISQLFAERGEAAFRELEREAIERAAQSRAVVALGGGAMAQPGAPERLRALGTVVYLEATPQQLLRRIGDPDSRPLLAGLDRQQRLDRLRVLLEERGDSYRQSHLVFDAGAVTMEAAASGLAVLLSGEGCDE